jgi:DNA-binding transcriptional LysR family regulator
MDAAACLVLRRLLTGIGMTPSADEVELHRRVGTGRLDVAAGRPAIAAAAAWLARIADNNRTCRTYPDPVLRAIVGGVWFRACYPMVHEGAWIVREYLAVHSAVCRGAGLTWVPVFVAAAIKASLRRLRGGGSPVHSPPGTKDDDMPVHG